MKLFNSLLLLFGLFVHLNAQISLNTTLESNWDDTSLAFNDIWGYVDDEGNEYAILGARTKVLFFDVTDPTTPTLLADFTGDWIPGGISGVSSTWRDMKVYDRYVYAVADSGNEGLMVFDMSALPGGNINKICQDNSDFGKAHNIFVDVPNGRLYVVGSNTQNSGVIIYDVASNPASPTIIGNVSLSGGLGGYIHDIFVQDNIGYCSSAYAGMYIIDFTIPTSPTLLASLNTGGYNHSNWIYEDGTKLLYAEEVPAGLPLGILDLDEVAMGNLTIINKFKEPLEAPAAVDNIYHNPFIVDSFAIVSSYQDGITIYNIDDPMNPVLRGYYDTYPSNVGDYSGYAGCWGTYPFLPSGNILASDISTGLYVISTSLPISSECGNGVLDAFEQELDCGGFCMPCESTLCKSDLNFTNNVPIDTTTVSNTITASTSLKQHINVVFQASLINLESGFEVPLDTEFLGEIAPCTPISTLSPTIDLFEYSDAELESEDVRSDRKILYNNNNITVTYNDANSLVYFDLLDKYSDEIKAITFYQVDLLGKKTTLFETTASTIYPMMYKQLIDRDLLDQYVLEIHYLDKVQQIRLVY